MNNTLHPTLQCTNRETDGIQPSAVFALGLHPKALHTVYQPIFDLSGPRLTMQAFECLARGPTGTTLESPEILFTHARFQQAEAALDRAAIASALDNAGDLLGMGLDLHLNVHATTLSPSFAKSLAEVCQRHDLSRSQVVLEVLEHGNEVDRDAIRCAAASLRELGFRIALDDTGIGQSNFLMIYLTRPEVVKIDRFFVRGVSHDPVRRATVVAIQQLASELGAVVVAEGVEEPDDLHALYDLGIRRVQGFLLARPATATEWTAREHH